MSRTRTFFAWQHDLLLGLLGWGAGSIVVGAGLARQRSEVLRQIGIQALGWGVIDALLALVARRGTQRNLTLVATATPDPAEITAAKSFQRLVAINAVLDLLYVAVGVWLSQAQRADRRGLGIGLAIQGLFLLIYDSLLVWWSARWRATYGG